MTMDRAYFDQMYAASDDPWGFTTRWYEKRKYALTLTMLPGEHYDSAFEPGCSIGIMTEQLAPRCTRVLSCDVAPAAVQSAAARASRYPGVRVERRILPREWPSEDFDLIVFSEFLYYFGGPDLQVVLDLARSALRPGGTPCPSIRAAEMRCMTCWPVRAGSAASPGTGSRTSSLRPT